MEIDIITKQDLESFKTDLLHEIKEILKPDPLKKWIRTKQVREILGVSSSTLQTMRIKREIPFSKIGGIIYYAVEGIEKLLDRNLRSSD